MLVRCKELNNLFHLALKSLTCLVQRDCDVTIGDKNNALPIHSAAAKNKRECVKYLVQQGANLLSTQKDGKTAIHLVSTQIMVYFSVRNLCNSLRNSSQNLGRVLYKLIDSSYTMYFCHGIFQILGIAMSKYTITHIKFTVYSYEAISCYSEAHLNF